MSDQEEVKKVTIEDIKVGEVFWLSWLTWFGEDSVTGPAIVESSDGVNTNLRLIGSGGNINGKREEVIELDLKSLTEKCQAGEIRFPVRTDVVEKITNELRRVKGMQDYLASYEALLGQFGKKFSA